MRLRIFEIIWVANLQNGGISSVVSGLRPGRRCAAISLPKGKVKFALWVRPETLDRVTEWYQQLDCVSKSEFIEKAIQFYVSYLTAEDGGSYLPNAFLSTMKSIVAESDNRHSKMMFKQAVELAMLLNVIAATHKIDREILERLRIECIKEVRRTNGNFSLDDAVDWQEGKE